MINKKPPCKNFYISPNGTSTICSIGEYGGSPNPKDCIYKCQKFDGESIKFSSLQFSFFEISICNQTITQGNYSYKFKQFNTFSSTLRRETTDYNDPFYVYTSKMQNGITETVTNLDNTSTDFSRNLEATFIHDTNNVSQSFMITAESIRENVVYKVLLFSSILLGSRKGFPLFNFENQLSFEDCMQPYPEVDIIGGYGGKVIIL